MRPQILPLLALGACQSGGSYGDGSSPGGLQRIENQSDARLILVSDDGNWNQDADTQWFVDCGNHDPEVVTVSAVDGELVIRSSDATLASACHVTVQGGRDAKEILVNGNGDLRIEGQVKHLVLLDVRGDGDVDIDEVTTARLDLFVTGSAEIDIGTLDCDDVLIDLSGDGEVTIAGASDNAVLYSNGSATLHAGDLILAVLHVEMTGSGEATVHVTDSISGFVGGSATFDVLGDPEGDVDAMGSGEVDFL